MLSPSEPPVAALPTDESFDLSDADDVDIVSSTHVAAGRPSPRRRAVAEQRADHADAVLAMCALWVFKDRRRKRGPGAARSLPGL